MTNAHDMYRARASAENFPGGQGGLTEKIPKISKKDRKIALFASSRGVGQRKKDRKIAKKGEK